jgi:hypothetical protein
LVKIDGATSKFSFEKLSFEYATASIVPSDFHSVNLNFINKNNNLMKFQFLKNQYMAQKASLA